ncbi:MAG: hypothetical protein ACLTSX_03075 [Collinsella sp.]
MLPGNAVTGTAHPETDEGLRRIMPVLSVMAAASRHKGAAWTAAGLRARAWRESTSVRLGARFYHRGQGHREHHRTRFA